MNKWLDQPAGVVAVVFDIALIMLAIVLAIGLSL